MFRIQLIVPIKSILILTGTCRFLIFIKVCFTCRCFYLTENARLEQASAVDRFVSSIGRNSHESIVGVGISGTFHSVLVQCSPDIFKVRTGLSITLI